MLGRFSFSDLQDEESDLCGFLVVSSGVLLVENVDQRLDGCVARSLIQIHLLVVCVCVWACLLYHRFMHP